ncbi:MAG: hypothetical protein CFE21_08970 [Bacteroidetes bacterium B1(2017)]|nr:MAG: hypothetical protein CFE21_08970 [Bacteroidetes bacterium B1(2017)]
MKIKSIHFLLLFSCLFPRSLFGQYDTLPKSESNFNGPYFYEGLTYGSQGNYNPATVLLNRGFEMLRITTGNLYYDPINYKYRFDNIICNLAHPIQNISDYGTKEFFLEQVIPFGDPKKPYWYPNYTLHLFGGGMTYTGLKEWFVSKKISHAGILSGATLLGAALINESIEERQRGGSFNLNVDAIADFYFFDIAGILLFQSKKVNYFFSKKLNMRDWSRQPMLLLPGVYMGNCGQFFSFKPRIPYTKSWYFFSMMGLGGLVGVSHTFPSNYGLSIGFGQGPKRKEKELLGLPIDVSLVPMAGLYLDKNNSLLASLELSNSKNDLYHNYFAELDVYPGLVKIGKKFSPGAWLALSKEKDVVFGINCNYTFGLGVGMHP